MAAGGDWGAFAEDDAKAAIHRARELGVNFFDTAQTYGFGASERLLGAALRGELRRRRDELVIATKGGLRRTATGIARDASPGALREGVDASLTALGVDHIDLYQVHWPDPKVPFAETAGALKELVEAGKIRHVGVSNYSAEQMAEFSRTLPVETLQPPYHLFRREIEDTELPYTRQHGIGVLVYGPLAHGLLSGILSKETVFPADDWRAKSNVFRGETYGRNLAVVRELQEFAAFRDMTVSQLAVAWTLAQPGVDVDRRYAARPPRRGQPRGGRPVVGRGRPEGDRLDHGRGRPRRRPVPGGCVTAGREGNGQTTVAVVDAAAMRAPSRRICRMPGSMRWCGTGPGREPRRWLMAARTSPLLGRGGSGHRIPDHYADRWPRHRHAPTTPTTPPCPLGPSCLGHCRA
ncbi:aldo/keto reductase [Streptomyces sp. 900105755]